MTSHRPRSLGRLGPHDALVRFAGWTLLGCALGASAGAGGARAEGPQLRSPAFPPGGEIPVVYTCDGKDRSPPLEWSDLPAGTRSLVLIVDDPDAPDPRAPRRTWVHWVVYDLPPSVTGLPAGAASGDLPPGTRNGRNDWNRTGYGGPCPPVGRHRYFHKLYALDVQLGDLGHPTKAELLARTEGHVLGSAELIGTYERP